MLFKLKYLLNASLTVYSVAMGKMPPSSVDGQMASSP